MALNNSDEIKFEITEPIAVLSESGNGWTTEINKVSWNGREPKYDIRKWAPEHEHPGKGISLTDEEMSDMLSALADIEL